jgi:hypothetical protein
MEQKRKRKSNQLQKSMTEALAQLFKDYIGLENGLSKEEILHKLFGKGQSFLQTYYDWRHKVLPAMHYLRTHTKCFIVSGDFNGSSVFFVIKREEEAAEFKRKNNKQIDGLEKTSIRASKAVREQWYKEL